MNRYRHIRTGGVYTIIRTLVATSDYRDYDPLLFPHPRDGERLEALVQVDGTMKAGESVIIYQGEDGLYWARPLKEFIERFDFAKD